MIRREGNMFHICTKSTGYIFRIEDAQHPEHLHYGKNIQLNDDSERALKQKHSSLPSATINYEPSFPNLSMELLRGEISSLGKGDYGDPFIDLEFSDGSRTCDFIFACADISSVKPDIPGLPSALPPADAKDSTLKITLKEANQRPVKLHLYYTAYEDCDIITRSAVLENTGSEPVILRKMLSSQIDFEDSDYLLTNFYGSWTNEMNKSTTPCAGKSIINETRLGFSSNRANPFVMLSRPDCTETTGEVYGSNLIYSGSHRECAQSGELDRLRFSTGMQPEGFLWTLNGGELFYTPEAVLSYSQQGFMILSRNFHDFIRNYIVRGTWAKKPRPILLNSWEAAYFDFTEQKLADMASVGKNLGIELFVLDDGWFGDRNSTKTSMGDWVCNEKKLPDGIESLSGKIHDLGMSFGIWVEPEAISVDSDLFRAHPEWALSVPGQPNSEGRSTRLIDLCNPEVIEYLYRALCRIFSSGVDYVKWDMNRGISDCYSPYLETCQQGETSHRYILGLYTLLDKLTKRFPDILFESCASGGNRADLGILSYMPQFWASDNSDALCRMKIQTNYSYGYPLSVLGCHVSAVPNHQTMRETSISTRYEVAAYGLLGYELDPQKLSAYDAEDIKEQIRHYKPLREWMMNADLHRMKSGEGGYYSILIVSRDRKKASIMTFQEIFRSGRPMYVLKTHGLKKQACYHLRSRATMINVKPMNGRMITLSTQNSNISPIIRMTRETEDYTLYGNFLNETGIRLKSDFIGHNLDEETRYYPDYATRLYDLELVES